jgi:predicted NBD/HSP70 family sugar kinase
MTPVLDPLFRPAPIAWREFQRRARATGREVHVRFALEQGEGAVSRFEGDLFPEGHAEAADNFRRLERFVQLALWTRGGYRILFDGPAPLARQLGAYFRDDPLGRLDSAKVGERVYAHPIEIVETPELPPSRAEGSLVGGHATGCRIGFDLGGSDRKSAAVIDGRAVWSDEVEWDPYRQPDPQYHFDGIMDSLRRAAEHLPRVDAIGGSAAGVYRDNLVCFSSLFRSVPPALFEARAKHLFLEVQRAWGGVPFAVVNDGDATALMGAMRTRDGTSVLGVALGTSTAGGYVTGDGRIPPWLNEVSSAPVDCRLDAAPDSSRDRGVIEQYLSQQAVGRLLAPAGIDVPASMSLPDRLWHLQELMAEGDTRALDVYSTLGIYLGYALGQLADAYDFSHVLMVGRVTSGQGGKVMLDRAR